MMDEQARILRGKILGALLRDARLDAGKSMKKVGELIGVSSATISSYEHGRRLISLPELELLAYHLDVPLQRFIDPSTQDLEEEAHFDPQVMITLRQRMIAAMLRQRRLELGLSQKQLAAAASMPPSRVSAYERGDRAIPIPDLESLLKVLDQDVSEYLDREGPVGKWHRSQEAFERFRELPEELQEFLSDEEHRSYLRMAQQLSRIPLEDLRAVAEALQDLVA